MCVVLIMFGLWCLKVKVACLSWLAIDVGDIVVGAVICVVYQLHIYVYVCIRIV